MTFKQICLGLITASFMAIAAVQLGVVKPAHAVSVNVAVRMIEKMILGSEERIIEEIKASCSEKS